MVTSLTNDRSKECALKTTLSVLILFLFFTPALAQIKVGLLKYGGGGDWYANPTSLPNLVKYVKEQTDLDIYPTIETVTPTDPNLYEFNVLHTTGHGNIVFTPTERENLRVYLSNGGFLHVDDNYGMIEYVKKEFAILFPGLEWQVIPPTYGLFSAVFPFPNGLPKIHEHDQKPPVAYGLFQGNRLMVLFTHESDLGDGWEDEDVHDDPWTVREQALKMGTNIIVWAITQ